MNLLQLIPALMLIIPLILIFLNLKRNIPDKVTGFTFFVFFLMAVLLYFFSGLSFRNEYKIFLTINIGMDNISYLFLLFTTFIYCIGWFFAESYFSKTRLKNYYIFYLVTYWGALGTIFSQDMLSFYCFYSVMGLSIYPLVILSRNKKSMYAGKIYLVFALLGEMMILSAIFILFSISGTTNFQVSLDSLIGFEYRMPVSLLLLYGFGIKIGIFPLHSVLPVIYRKSPTPFAAVLGGALISIGVLGLIRFLPLGRPGFVELGIFMCSLGIFTFIFAVIVTFFQSSPKAILGYSSISQMAIIMMAMGTVFINPESYDELLFGVLIYTFFHAIVKSSLFFSVGVLEIIKEFKIKRVVLLFSLLPMLAIIGLPFTAGSFAKYALKHSIESSDEFLKTVLSVMGLAPLGSSFILFVFLYHLVKAKSGRKYPVSKAHSVNDKHILLLSSWAAIIFVTALMPALFLSETSVLYIKYAVWDTKNIISASYPFVIALLLAVVFLAVRKRLFPNISFKIREGDIIVFFESLVNGSFKLYKWISAYEKSTFLKKEITFSNSKMITDKILSLEKLLIQNYFWGILLLIFVSVLFLLLCP